VQPTRGVLGGKCFARLCLVEGRVFPAHGSQGTNKLLVNDSEMKSKFDWGGRDHGGRQGGRCPDEDSGTSRRKHIRDEQAHNFP
jgi:hypothetical protein